MFVYLPYSLQCIKLDLNVYVSNIAFGDCVAQFDESFSIPM